MNQKTQHAEKLSEIAGMLLKLMDELKIPFLDARELVEARAIEIVLREKDGARSRAAYALKMIRTTFIQKIKRYGLDAVEAPKPSPRAPKAKHSKIHDTKTLLAQIRAGQ